MKKSSSPSAMEPKAENKDWDLNCSLSCFLSLSSGLPSLLFCCDCVLKVPLPFCARWTHPPGGCLPTWDDVDAFLQPPHWVLPCACLSLSPGPPQKGNASTKTRMTNLADFTSLGVKRPGIPYGDLHVHSSRHRIEWKTEREQHWTLEIWHALDGASELLLASNCGDISV